jgi:hypothetical protein
MGDDMLPAGRRILMIVCFMLWPFVAGAAALALVALIVFGLIGGHYGELALMVYGPVALGMLLVAALLREISSH